VKGKVMTFPAADGEERHWLRGRPLPKCWLQRVSG
jgi:hypothetical protein